jgi:hypothetical protein
MHLERVNRAAATASLAISQPCGLPCLLPGHAATGTTGSLPLRQLTVVGSAAVTAATADAGAGLVVAAAVHAELEARPTHFLNRVELFRLRALRERRSGLRPRQ